MTHEPIADGTSLKVTLGGQLKELQKWVYATPGIILATIAVHAILSRINPGVPILDSEVIAKYGDYGTEVANGEWWRIFTSMWLHINAMHLVSNMVALGIIGRSVERMIGWRGFLLMYLLSGIGGALATDIAIPYALSIGASGAVFGVFGCLVGFTVRYPGQFPSQGLNTLMWAGVAFLGYNVTFGTGPGINWISHASGFVTGGICGAFLSAPIEPHAIPGRRWRDARLAIGAAVVIAGTLFALHGRIPNVRVAITELFERDAAVTERARTAAATGDPAALATEIDQHILPDVRDTRAYRASLDRLPKYQQVPLVAFDAYLATRERAWTLLSAGLATTDLDISETAHYLHEGADIRRDRLFEDFADAAESPPTETERIAPVVAPVIDALAGK